MPNTKDHLEITGLHMKKRLLAATLLCAVCLAGCSVEVPEDVFKEKYPIGAEVELGGVKFNIYKVDAEDEELYLLARESIATTLYSDSEHRGDDLHDYVGSYVYDYIEDFADDLQDNQGIELIWAGLIDAEDLSEIGSFESSGGLSGRPYHAGDDTPEFVTCEDSYWVGGYCKFDTYSWAYHNGYYDMEQCYKNEYGVRPAICVKAEVLENAQDKRC